LKEKNTHTTKKYAIDVISELRLTALEALGNGMAPDEDQHKLKAVKAGSAKFKAVDCIKKIAAKVIRKGQCYGHHVQVVDLVETPITYTKAMAEYEKAKPARDKVLGKIDTAYETAERCIMLGGSDTVIGEAIAKLEKSLKGLK